MAFMRSVFKRPVTIVLIILVIIGVGVYSACGMAINLLPDISFPILTVQTVYAGADAETVDKMITRPMEDSFGEISGVKSVSTYSIDNCSIIMLQFEYGTKLDAKEKEIEAKINALTLPSGAEKPSITDIDLNSTSMFALTVYSENDNMEEILDTARRIESEMAAIPGVGKTKLTGAPGMTVKVTMINGLEAFVPLIVQELVKDSSYDIPLGDIAGVNGAISVKNASSAKTVEELKDLVIGVEIPEAYTDMFLQTRSLLEAAGDMTNEELLALLDSLNVGDTLGITLNERLIEFIRNAEFRSGRVIFKLGLACDAALSSEYESRAYYNGKEAVRVDLFGAGGGNAAAIGDEAQKIIEKYNKNSSGVKVAMLNNESDFITDSLSNALVSLLIGMLLAVLVIYLFLRRIKSSLIIAISMPLSVLLTLACLHLMGITLNMVSVGGIAVGIGMLVDNSIIVLESITSEKQKGKDVLRASVDGVKLVMGSLIGSTLTSICVFFPILFIKGLTREIFADLSWAVIFSLSFSLLVAIFIIPTLFCLFFKKDREKTPPQKKKPGFFQRLTDLYSRLLEKCLRKKGLTIAVCLVVFAASISLIFTYSIEFLPSVDEGKIEVTIPFDAGDSNEYCQETAMEAYRIISENIDGIDNMALSVGYAGLIRTSQSGTISIKLKTAKGNTRETVEKIREVLNDKGFSHDFSVIEIDGIVATIVGGMIGSVSVTVTGESSETLAEIAEKIEADVTTKNGIKRASDNNLPAVESCSVVFDKEALLEQSIDYETAVKTMRIGLAGYGASTVLLNGSEYRVEVGWNDGAIDYYGTLGDVTIGVNGEGRFVKLSECAEIRSDVSRRIIRKENGLNVLEISVETYGIDTNTATKLLKESAEKVLKDYRGYSYEASGVSSYLKDAFSGLVKALVISFFLLFAIMACLFESVKKPLIIIFSFPFAFTGGFIALALTGVGLNVVSFIGLIMLMGVIINDAIVLNERIDQLRAAGLDANAAVIEGCRQRIRAVLMTSLTTILALIPMALGIGRGGGLMQPLGVVAIGGMTLGTCVTLILIPAVYCVFYRIKYKKENPVFTGEGYLAGSTPGESGNAEDTAPV